MTDEARPDWESSSKRVQHTDSQAVWYHPSLSEPITKGRNVSVNVGSHGRSKCGTDLPAVLYVCWSSAEWGNIGREFVTWLSWPVLTPLLQSHSDCTARWGTWWRPEEAPELWPRIARLERCLAGFSSPLTGDVISTAWAPCGTLLEGWGYGASYLSRAPACQAAGKHSR